MNDTPAGASRRTRRGGGLATRDVHDVDDAVARGRSGAGRRARTRPGKPQDGQTADTGEYTNLMRS